MVVLKSKSFQPVNQQSNRDLIKKLIQSIDFLVKYHTPHTTTIEGFITLQMENGNIQLRDHWDNAPCNATYQSYATVVDLLSKLYHALRIFRLALIIRKVLGIKHRHWRVLKWLIWHWQYGAIYILDKLDFHGIRDVNIVISKLDVSVNTAQWSLNHVVVFVFSFISCKWSSVLSTIPGTLARSISFPWRLPCLATVWRNACNSVVLV